MEPVFRPGRRVCRGRRVSVEIIALDNYNYRE